MFDFDKVTRTGEWGQPATCKNCDGNCAYCHACIQLLEYPIPPPRARALRHKKSRLRYLGKEKSYQRSAGVTTTRKKSECKKRMLKILSTNKSNKKLKNLKLKQKDGFLLCTIPSLHCCVGHTA